MGATVITEATVRRFLTQNDECIGVRLEDGTEITADFSEDGTLSGNASCNQYNTNYEVDGEKITIGMAVVTEMFCPEPQGIMEQEAQYLAALGTADTYKIQGLNMEMRTSEGSLVASFKRIENP